MMSWRKDADYSYDRRRHRDSDSRYKRSESAYHTDAYGRDARKPYYSDRRHGREALRHPYESSSRNANLSDRDYREPARDDKKVPVRVKNFHPNDYTKGYKQETEYLRQAERQGPFYDYNQDMARQNYHESDRKCESSYSSQSEHKRSRVYRTKQKRNSVFSPDDKSGNNHTRNNQPRFDHSVGINRGDFCGSKQRSYQERNSHSKPDQVSYDYRHKPASTIDRNVHKNERLVQNSGNESADTDLRLIINISDEDLRVSNSCSTSQPDKVLYDYQHKPAQSQTIDKNKQNINNNEEIKKERLVQNSGNKRADTDLRQIADFNNMLSNDLIEQTTPLFQSSPRDTEPINISDEDLRVPTEVIEIDNITDTDYRQTALNGFLNPVNKKETSQKLQDTMLDISKTLIQLESKFKQNKSGDESGTNTEKVANTDISISTSTSINRNIRANSISNIEVIAVDDHTPEQLETSNSYTSYAGTSTLVKAPGFMSPDHDTKITGKRSPEQKERTPGTSSSKQDARIPGIISSKQDARIPGVISSKQDATILGILSAEQEATISSVMSQNRDTIPYPLSDSHCDKQEVIHSDQELNVEKSQHMFNETRNHQWNPINTAYTEPTKGGQKSNLLDKYRRPWLYDSSNKFSEYQHGQKPNRERRKSSSYIIGENQQGKKSNRERRQSNEHMKHDNKYRNTENRYERREETQQYNYRQKDTGNKSSFDSQNQFVNQKPKHPERKLSLGKQEHENSWRQINQENCFKQDKNSWKPKGQIVQERNTTKAAEWSKDKNLITKEEGVKDGKSKVKSSSTGAQVNQDGTDAAKETGKKSLKDFKIPKICKNNKESHNKDRIEEDEPKHTATNEIKSAAKNPMTFTSKQRDQRKSKSITISSDAESRKKDDLKHTATNEIKAAVKNPFTFTSKQKDQDKSKTISSSSDANLNIFEKLNASKLKEVEKQSDNMLKSEKEKPRNEKPHSYDLECSGIFDRMTNLLKNEMAKKNRESKVKDSDRPMSYLNGCRKETFKETRPSEGFASDDAPSNTNSKYKVKSVKDLKYVNGQLYWKNRKVFLPNIELNKMTTGDVKSMKINIKETKTVQVHKKLNSKNMEKVYLDKRLKYRRIRSMNDSESSTNSSPIKFDKKQVKPLTDSESETELSSVAPRNEMPHILSESDNEKSPVICRQKTAPVLSKIKSQLSPETSEVGTSEALYDDELPESIVDELEDSVCMEIGSDDGFYMEIGSDDETQQLKMDLIEIKQESEVSEIKTEHSDTECSSSGFDKSNIKSEFDCKQRDVSESENKSKIFNANAETSTHAENTNNSLELDVSELDKKASSGKSLLTASQSSARNTSQLGSIRHHCAVSVTFDSGEEDDESQSILDNLTGRSNVKSLERDSLNYLVNEIDDSNGKEYSQKCDKKTVSNDEKYSDAEENDPKIDKMTEKAVSHDDDLPVIKRPKERKRMFLYRSSIELDENTVSQTNNTIISHTNHTPSDETNNTTSTETNDTTVSKTNDTAVSKSHNNTVIKANDASVSKINDTTVSKTNSNSGHTSDQICQIPPVKRKRLFKPSKNIPSAAKEEEAGNEGDVEDNLNAYDEPIQKFANVEAFSSYNTALDDNSATQQYSFPSSDNETQEYEVLKVENCSKRNSPEAVEEDGNSMSVKEEPNWLKNGYTQEPDTIFISDDEDFDMVMSVSQPIINLDSSGSDDEDVKIKTPAKIKVEVDEHANPDIDDPDYWDVSSLADDSDKGSDYEPDNFFEMISRLSEVKHVDSDEEAENEAYSDNDPYMSSDNEDLLFNQHDSKTGQAAEFNEHVKSIREENVGSADIYTAGTQPYLAANEEDELMPCSQTQVGENMDMFMQDTQVDLDTDENSSNQISALEYYSEFFSDHSDSSTETGRKDVPFKNIKNTSDVGEVEKKELPEKIIYIEDVDDVFSIESSADESDMELLNCVESISRLETQEFQISDNEDVVNPPSNDGQDVVVETQSFDENERYTEATQIDVHQKMGDNSKSSSKDDSDYYGSETQMIDNNGDNISDYSFATQIDKDVLYPSKGYKVKRKGLKQTIESGGETQVLDNKGENLTEYLSATQVDKDALHPPKGKAVKHTIDYEVETQLFDNDDEDISDYLFATQVDKDPLHPFKGKKVKGKAGKQTIDYEVETQSFDNDEEDISGYLLATQVDKGLVHPSKGRKANGKAVKQTIDYGGETQVLDNNEENLTEYLSATQVDKDTLHPPKRKAVKQSIDYEVETQLFDNDDEDISDYLFATKVDKDPLHPPKGKKVEGKAAKQAIDYEVETQLFDNDDEDISDYLFATQVDKDLVHPFQGKKVKGKAGKRTIDYGDEQIKLDRDTHKEGISKTASLATKHTNYEDETQSFDAGINLQDNYVVATQVYSTVEDDERYNAETQNTINSDPESSDQDELLIDPQYKMYIQTSTGLSSSKFNAQLGIKFDTSFRTELKFPDDDVCVIMKSKTFEGQVDIYSAQTQHTYDGSSVKSNVRDDDDAYMEQTQLDPQYSDEEEDKLQCLFLAQTQIDQENVDSDESEDQSLIQNDNLFDMLTQMDSEISEHQDNEENETDSGKRSEELSLQEQVSEVKSSHAVKSSEHFKGKRPYAEVNQRESKWDERKKNLSVQPKSAGESHAKKAKIDTKLTQLEKETTKSIPSGRSSASIESEHKIPNLCVQGRKTIMIDPINSRSGDPKSGPNYPLPRSKGFLANTSDILIADATKDDMWLSKKSAKDKGKSKPEKRKRNKSNDTALESSSINEARLRLQERNMKCIINPDCAADPNKRLKHSTLLNTANNEEDVNLPSFSQVIKGGYPILDTSRLHQPSKSSQPGTALCTEVTTSTATIVTNTMTIATTTAPSTIVSSNIHGSIPTCSVVNSMSSSHMKTSSKRDVSKSDGSTSRVKSSEQSKSDSHKSSKITSKVKSSDSNEDDHQKKSSHHKHEHKIIRSDQNGDKKSSKKSEHVDKSNKDRDKKSSKKSEPLDKSNKDGDKKSSKKHYPLDKSNKDGDKKSSKKSEHVDKSNKGDDEKSRKKSEPSDKSKKDRDKKSSDKSEQESVSLHRKDNKMSEKSANRKGQDVSGKSHEKRDRHSSGKEKSLCEKSQKDVQDKSMNQKDQLNSDKSCENKNNVESEKSNNKQNKHLSETSQENKDKDVINKRNSLEDKYLQQNSLEKGEKDSRSQSSKEKSKVIYKKKSDKSSLVRDGSVLKTDERGSSNTRDKSGIKQKFETVIKNPDAKQKNVTSDMSKLSDLKTSDNSESIAKTLDPGCQKYCDEQNNKKERSHIRKDTHPSDKGSEVSLCKQPLRDLHSVNNIKTTNISPVGINLIAKIAAGNTLQSSGSVLTASNTNIRESLIVSSIKPVGKVVKKQRKVTWCDNIVQVKEISPDYHRLRPSTSTENLMKKLPPAPSFLPIQNERLPPDLMKMTNPVKWDKVITIILKWNSLWFVERDNMEQGGCKKCDAPPVAEQLGVADTKALFPLVRRYASLDEYINKFMLPLLLHETWQSLYSDWREKKNREKNYKLKLLLNQYANIGEKLQEYTFIGLMSREERNLSNLFEQDLVTLKICQVKMAGAVQALYRDVLGLVVSVTYKDSPGSVHRICSQNEQLAKIRKPDSIQVILTVRVHKRKFTPSQDNLTELQPVSSILSMKRQIDALNFFQKSPLCRDLLYPTLNAAHCERATASMSHVRKKLNESQSVAVNTAVRMATQVAAATPRVCLLQGPPGTGKSFTIINIIHKIVKEKKGKCHICLTAPSHAAVDELLRKLHRMNLDQENKDAKIKVVRLGKMHSIHPDVQSYSLDNQIKKRFKETLLEKMQDVPQSLRAEIITVKKKILEVQNSIRASKDKFQIQKWSSDLVRLKKEMENLESKFQIDKTNIPPGIEKKVKWEVLNGAHVIAGTLSSMGSSLLKMFLSKSNAFDCVIVDEATQATEIDTLIPLQYGATKLILVGDPEQLSPTVLSQVAQENKFNMSLFERLYNHFNDSGNITNPVLFLDTQYRMDKEIASFPNNYIYDRKLKTAAEHNKCNLVPYLLFDIREGEEQFSQGSRSMSNQMEAVFTAELCQFILQKTKFSEKSIGIIAPYSKQKGEVLKQLALRRLKSIEVSTVDGFQGREKHIVIMTCVRAVSGSLGFVGNRNRMNVALTRAKYAMYLVGNFQALESSAEWRALINDAKQRNKMVTVSTDTYAKDICSCLKK